MAQKFTKEFLYRNQIYNEMVRKNGCDGNYENRVIKNDTLVFIKEHVYKTIDKGDKCKTIYNKYIKFLENKYFDEEIPTQITFNKVLKKWFNTDYDKISGIHVWNNLIYRLK